ADVDGLDPDEATRGADVAADLEPPTRVHAAVDAEVHAVGPRLAPHDPDGRVGQLHDEVVAAAARSGRLVPEQVASPEAACDGHRLAVVALWLEREGPQRRLRERFRALDTLGHD